MLCPVSREKNCIKLNRASSDSKINKPQRGRPKRAELLDVNINTGVQSINTEKASLRELINLRSLVHCADLQS